MQSEALIAIIIFIIAYALIISEKIHRTIAAMTGASLLLLFGVLSQNTAIKHIDFNTIGLLTGMMIIVSITAQTGLFKYISIRSAQMVNGQPFALLIVFSLITAVGSAFLDNVTTVLLVVPVTLSIARQLAISPTPFLMSEIFMSNIGGTATMIGDPPNIMIGSAVHELSFLDFITNLTPVVLLIVGAILLMLGLIYRHSLQGNKEARMKIAKLNACEAIKDKTLLIKALVVLFLTIIGFFLHEFIGAETATIALAGAFFLLLLSGERYLEDALAGVEWTTLFFFVGLFVLVAGLVETGVIASVAKGALTLTGGKLVPTTFLILWMSAIASSVIDNIPFVATMIPLIKDMGELGVTNLEPLWWSLSLGACLGGNGLLIGASANLVVAALSGRGGHRITFIRFMKLGIPVMLLSMVISTIYVYLRYLL
ncbi:ArsB/NhaD family transporter [Sporolactobacillus shoreicorticis]|uniref:ArsB/NhaD family transporter n=1 Tax=Sporolactobacillus shoreicorticis TaxID=1923877 RepID=A0ABW5RZI7_9BACL|nr:ArsB/NhaD family transporter [Sporolactobacillus shoreicorticis]MCO7128041.1 ArsB/NhaD family transporter [Sporolactobacillus shoreicorticis]